MPEVSTYWHISVFVYNRSRINPCVHGFFIFRIYYDNGLAPREAISNYSCDSGHRNAPGGRRLSDRKSANRYREAAQSACEFPGLVRALAPDRRIRARRSPKRFARACSSPTGRNGVDGRCCTILPSLRRRSEFAAAIELLYGSIRAARGNRLQRLIRSTRPMCRKYNRCPIFHTTIRLPPDAQPANRQLFLQNHAFYPAL